MIWGKTDAQRLAERDGLWFAWRPVRLDDGRWCWLDDVWRTYESHSPDDYGFYYRTPGSLA